MNSFIFRNMYRGVKVFAFGKFYSDSGFLSGWGFSALLEMADREFYEEIFCVSRLNDFGAIFKSRSEGCIEYESHELVASFCFPPIMEWSESRLSDCPATPRFIGEANDFFSQRSFCLSVDGVNVWLPKLELAGRMFFHYETLISAAFVPSGLDFNFCTFESDNSTEVHATSKIGVDPWVFENTSYRNHLGWLLTSRDVRDSFNSIWYCLNQEKIIRPDGRYEWDFNFVPPVSLSGSKVTVMGCLSPDKKNFMIWEIVKIEIAVAVNKNLIFYHPDLKCSNNYDFGCSDFFPSPVMPTDSILFVGGGDAVVSYECPVR